MWLSKSACKYTKRFSTSNTFSLFLFIALVFNIFKITLQLRLETRDEGKEISLKFKTQNTKING